MQLFFMFLLFISVRVVRAQTKEIIVSLVFLQGYPLPNVALKGEATQSSTLSLATASKAIDGRRNSFYSDGFCSHTAEDETNPWWRVDLQRSFTVTAVKVTNRGDCCAERLDGAEIRIGNSLENNGNNNPSCGMITSLAGTPTYTFQCNEMEGRYVIVIIPGKKTSTTLCEVEVFASLSGRVFGCYF
uniref:Fucolectin tachylectin-4 pentraxin-1 domain-containing protein n=1 Tax=Oreochromis aureus TaxID=47969 RepID=A0AAZ1XAS6_OREAU